MATAPQSVYVSNASSDVSGYPYINVAFLDSNSTSVSTLNQSSQVVILDGYSTNNLPYMFKGVVNFSLCNPIYTDDENDVITMTLYLGDVSDSSGAAYDICCYLSNLGQMVSSPIYATTPQSDIITIPVNKWFALRAPGSTYQFTITGTRVTNTNNNTCNCPNNNS